jgi:hypothetical protein
MSLLLQKHFFSILAGILLLFTQSQETFAQEVNGLFYGDGDDQQYELIASNDGGRGDLYARLVDEHLYIAVIVDPSVNDNVFGDKQTDSDYLASAGWNNPSHKAGDLLRSEHIELLFQCGDESWTWKQDYIYDIDRDENPSETDWVSDQDGPDGDGTPPPGYQAASSFAWNLNNSLWDVTMGGTRPNLNDWKSPDNGSGDVATMNYPMYSDDYKWEWPIVYEMRIDLSQCADEGYYIEVLTAHNSPPKTDPPDVPIKLRDYGDLPDGPYSTLLASDGARHIIVPGIYLGSMVDPEANGQPGAAANGDDLAFTDDEDGIEFLTKIESGSEATVRVTASVDGKLDAWMDFDNDGSFDEVDDKVFNSINLTAGPNDLSFDVPIDAETGSLYARFRFSTGGGLSYMGEASDGEVEDYFIQGSRVPVEMSSLSATLADRTVEIQWVTASEEENLGFYILRSESTEGDYQRLNDELIQGAGNSSVTNSYRYRDSQVTPGRQYYYTVVDVSYNGVEETHGPVQVNIPPFAEYAALQLQPPNPNPVREDGTISYSIPSAGNIRLAVYDLSGRQQRILADGHFEAGDHNARFSRLERGRRLGSGAYILRLETNNGVQTQRMILTE